MAFSASLPSSPAPAATPLPDLTSLRARVDALTNQRQRVLTDVRRRITAATEGQSPSERADLDSSILSSAVSKVEEDYSAKLKEFPVTLDTVAARAEAVAPPGGERCPCLRRCVERAYVVWGEAVLGVLLAVTGVKRPPAPSPLSSATAPTPPFSAAGTAPPANSSEGTGGNGNAAPSSSSFAASTLQAVGASKDLE
jgi:hypothetical protein